jgi:dUTP pyrophosphatase
MNKTMHLIATELERNYPDSPDQEYNYVLCGIDTDEVMDIDDDDPERKSKYIYPHELKEISINYICPGCWKTYLTTVIEAIYGPKSVLPKTATKLKILQLDKEMNPPSRAYSGDAGFDLYSRIDKKLYRGEFAAIPTGIIIEVAPGYEAQIRPKSGLSLNHGITIVNSPGTVDSGFRNEVMAIVRNEGREPFDIRRNTKICQMVICKLPEVDVEFVETFEDLTPSERGKRGWGSSGL